MLERRRKINVQIKSIAAEAVNTGDTNLTDAIDIALDAPMHVQGMHTRVNDPQSHLVVINVEALICALRLSAFASALTSHFRRPTR